MSEHVLSLEHQDEPRRFRAACSCGWRSAWMLTNAVMGRKSGHELDHCPTCGRKILDFDPNGYEDERGQRGCLTHKEGGRRHVAAKRRAVKA